MEVGESLLQSFDDNRVLLFAWKTRRKMEQLGMEPRLRFHKRYANHLLVFVAFNRVPPRSSFHYLGHISIISATCNPVYLPNPFNNYLIINSNNNKKRYCLGCVSAVLRRRDRWLRFPLDWLPVQLLRRRVQEAPRRAVLAVTTVSDAPTAPSIPSRPVPSPCALGKDCRWPSVRQQSRS